MERSSDGGNGPSRSAHQIRWYPYNFKNVRIIYLVQGYEKSVMIESSITAKGQTTLPVRVREALSVQPGDRVRYVIQGDEVRILVVRSVDRLFGILRHDGPPVTLEDMERAVAEGPNKP